MGEHNATSSAEHKPMIRYFARADLVSIFSSRRSTAVMSETVLYENMTTRALRVTQLPFAHSVVLRARISAQSALQSTRSRQYEPGSSFHPKTRPPKARCIRLGTQGALCLRHHFRLCVALTYGGCSSDYRPLLHGETHILTLHDDE